MHLSINLRFFAEFITKNYQISKMKELKLHSYLKKWLLLLFIIANSTLFAQVSISGKVTNAKGDKLNGSSVQIKNTNIGSVTDANGNYTFSTSLKKGKYILQVSNIGYKVQELSFNVTDASSYSFNFTLSEDISGLDEVIVTGNSLGTTRKQLGSYVSTVKGDQITKAGSSNVLAALQGKTPGAQIIQNNGDPAGGISVRLRGISSILSSSEPLYIVDGVIVNNATNRVTNTSSNYDGNNFVGTIGQNRLADINPADIEKIEVLNGAAAAAIYGSRANAGVVQIFTKRGLSGKAQIQFSSKLSINSLRKKIDVNRAPTKFGGPTDGVGALTQDILVLSAAGTTNVTRYDYQDDIFRTGIGSDNNISISGGTDKTKYFMSGSYFSNEGIVKNTNFQRYSFRVNVDQTLNNWASFNLGLNYVNSKSNEKPDGNSFFSPMNSVTIIGNFHNIKQKDALGNILAVGERGRVNPTSVIEDIKQQQITNRIITNASLKLKPIKGLTIDYTLGIDAFNQNGTTFIPPFSYNVNTAFFGGGLSLDPTLNGYASTANNNFFGINNDVNATYTTSINNDINSTTQIGFSQQYEKNNYSLLQGRGLAPFVQTVNGASTILSGIDERSELAISGAYIQQNFRYRNQLFITGAVRVDGSSVFGSDNRSQVYTKASASYLLSETDYWSKLSVAKWWNLFKLRMAYGESGNLTGIGAYSRFNTYSSSSFIGRTSLSSSGGRANENVKPERQKEFEMGADLSFLNNKLNVTINVYNKSVNDLLINRQIAPTTGFSTLLDNFGSLENKGIEVLVNTTVMQKKDFNWNITGIYNKNKNKALKIGQALTLFGTNQGAPVAILEGQPVGVFYGTFFATNGSGDLVKNSSGIPLIEKGTQINPLSYTTLRDGTGLPTGTTLRKIIGDPNPDYTATLVNEFSYKKWNLRMQIDKVAGVEVFNADFRTRQGVGNGKVAEQEHLGQIPRGYILGIYAIEEWRIDDGSFTKLRELSLSYNIGKLKGFSDITVSFSGRNLISWDNYKGYDPEVNAGGQSTILRGIDFGSVPIPKTFTFGIQAKF